MQKVVRADAHISPLLREQFSKRRADVGVGPYIFVCNCAICYHTFLLHDSFGYKNRDCVEKMALFAILGLTVFSNECKMDR